MAYSHSIVGNAVTSALVDGTNNSEDKRPNGLTDGILASTAEKNLFELTRGRSGSADNLRVGSVAAVPSGGGANHAARPS